MQQVTVEQLRRLPNATLKSFFTAEWARDAIRKKMPKYAGQLVAIANAKTARVARIENQLDIPYDAAMQDPESER